MEIRILRGYIRGIIVLLVGFLTTLSCERLPKPDFSFFPKDNAEAGDTIWFTNRSSRAQIFEWEFGDSETSSEESPTHVYKEAGIHEVKLNAFNESGKEFTTQPISIYEPTILGFSVYDDSGSHTLPGTSIWVYEDNSDRDSLTESVFFGITDNEGYVEFKNAEPDVYYVEVIKVATNGRWTQAGSTTALLQNKLNIFTIKCNWIEDD